MCLYVSNPLGESAPQLIHHRFSGVGAEGRASDRIVAYDVSAEMLIFADSVTMVGASLSSGTVVFDEDPASNYSKSVAISFRPAAQYGGVLRSSICHWLRACTSSEYVGSPCSATLSNVIYSGFCFEASTGSLECGHATHIGLGSLSISLPTKQLFRCASGSAAISLGSYVSERLPIAGCMLTSDAAFSSTAEVHVPAYCVSGSADATTGCMDPGAIDFEPLAIQPGTCAYQTSGCRSSTALNYNSEATLDGNESCIEPVYGCTLRPEAYFGVASDTPGYYDGYKAGKLYQTSGRYEPLAVLNYNQSATTLSAGSCVLAIEGCMDPTAVNYDSDATINTGTWCLPRLVGCMMPTNPRAGITVSYDASATVHNLSACHIFWQGCMDSRALNFQPRATVSESGTCYMPREGCLNPLALNYRCEKNRGQQLPCDDADAPVTVHARGACNWQFQPPAPPAIPAPSQPPGTTLVPSYTVSTVLQASGAVDEYDETRKASLGARFAESLGVSSDGVIVAIGGGSVVITVSIDAPSADDASAFQSSLSTSLSGSLEDAEEFLGGDLSLLAPPSVDVVVTYIVLPNAPPAVDITIATLLGLCVCCCCVRCIRRRRKSPKIAQEPGVMRTYGPGGRARVEYTEDDEASAPAPALVAEASPLRRQQTSSMKQWDANPPPAVSIYRNILCAIACCRPMRTASPKIAQEPGVMRTYGPGGRARVEYAGDDEDEASAPAAAEDEASASVHVPSWPASTDHPRQAALTSGAAQPTAVASTPTAQGAKPQDLPRCLPPLLCGDPLGAGNQSAAGLTFSMAPPTEQELAAQAIEDSKILSALENPALEDPRSPRPAVVSETHFPSIEPRALLEPPGETVAEPISARIPAATSLTSTANEPPILGMAQSNLTLTMAPASEQELAAQAVEDTMIMSALEDALGPM